MTFRPKQNRILAALGNGEVPVGMQISIGAPTVIEVLAYAGFDYCMLDMEHSRISLETMEHCIRAADASGITTLVRVAENDPNSIRHCIEAGAQGVVIPHIKNREEARKAVESVRYPPEGKCGICPAIRAANFSKTHWDDYLRHSSNQTMVIPLLEDKEAIEKAEEIFAELKSGVDAIGFGRGDLAQSIAQSGEKLDWEHPYLMEAYEKVLAISKRTNIPVIAMPWPETTPEYAKAAIAKGAKIILYSVDILLFYNLCLDIVRAMKHL
jgi:2-keto-3-deoxy-L-rhamnonate aldolase RhmA